MYAKFVSQKRHMQSRGALVFQVSLKGWELELVMRGLSKLGQSRDYMLAPAARELHRRLIDEVEGCQMPTQDQLPIPGVASGALTEPEPPNEVGEPMACMGAKCVCGAQFSGADSAALDDWLSDHDECLHDPFGLVLD